MARDVSIYPSGATSPSGYDATYTSMSLMEATEGANSGSHHIDCEIGASDGSWSGSPDTSNVEFDGWDCDYSTDRYLNIYTSGTAKPSADAFWDTSAYILKYTASAPTLEIDNDHDGGTSKFDAVFTDIQIEHDTSAQYNLYIHESPNGVDYLEFNRCWFQQGGAEYNIFSSFGLGTELLFVNCVMDGGTHGLRNNVANTLYLVNCDFVNATDDGIESDGYNVYPINCACFYNPDDFTDTFPVGYPLRCASDQGAGEGTTGVDLTPGANRDTDLAVTFEAPTTGDYRLTGVTTTANIIGVGTNQSENSRVPSVDMLGNARPTGANRPCIGAFEYETAGTTAALTGTAIAGGVLESEIVTGGETIIITLTGDTYVATAGDDNAITDAIIAGIDSAQSEAAGWDAVVKANMVFGDVARTSDTVLTVTLAAEATYAITANETITITLPATALTTSGDAVVAAPTFDVTNETDGIVIFRRRGRA